MSTLGADLDSAQARRRVRREERVAGAGREDRDASFLEVAHGAAPNVVLADLVDLQRRHDAYARAQALERVLHRKRVDDGREHAHLIGGHAIHAGLGQARAAEDIAAADDETDLDAEPDDFFDLGWRRGE